MKTSAISYIIFTSILLVISRETTFSQNNQANQKNTFLPTKYTSPTPILDSSINVSKLSYLSKNELLSKIYEVDQRYRIELHRAGWTLKNKQTDHCWQMMAINDPVDRVVLLKLLKLDGWPCDKNRGDESLSSKAWIIAWHGRGDYKELMKFYPYLLNAKKSGCIDNKLFSEFDITVKHLYNVGYR